MSDLTPEDRDRLAAKYGIHTGPGYGVQDSTPEQAAARAWAEQMERTIREVHQACEDYNGEKLAWITWELPTQVRERIAKYQSRLQEAQRRDSQFGEGIVHYYDDRNKGDEVDGWPAFDPDNPDHQTVPLGHILTDQQTVHVLRGGTEALFDRRDGLGRHQKPADNPAAHWGLPDFGHGYDFATFMRTAEKSQVVNFCDMHLPEGCANPFAGKNQRLVAVPMGRDIYVMTICAACTDALYESWRLDHPKVKVGTVRKRRRPGGPSGP